MVTYCSGLPSVMAFDEAYARHHLDGEAQRSALHITTDQPTGVAMFSLFTDDGHGNGNCILSVPVAELRALLKRLKAEG